LSIALGVVVSDAVGAAATDPAVAELRALVENQQRQIDELRARLAELAAPTAAAPAPAPTLAGDTTPALPATTTSSARSDEPAPSAADANAFGVGRFPDAAVVRSGTFPRAFTIPDSNLSVRVGGFVQADALADFGEMRSPYNFLASSIVRDGGNRARTNLTARNTRLNLDVRGDTVRGPGRIFIEGDFAGDGGSELVSNGTSFRLRHAFAQLGPFYAGQYWSAFVDLSALPETLDQTAPAGKSVTRQTGVRYVHRLPDFGLLSIALENPNVDVRGATSTREDVPDLLLTLRRDGARGHVQLTAVGRRLVAADSAGDEAEAVGYGANLTAQLHLASGEGRDRLSAGLIGGEGLGRYVVELAGLGLDARIQPADDSLDPTPVFGGYLSGQHWWTPRLRSTLAAGLVQAGVTAPDPAVSFERATTLLGNLLWNPVPPLTLGTELIWGRRENRDGSDDTALRLLTTARFSF
jgi:hypothetical protein